MKYSIRPHHIHKSKRFIFQDNIQAFSPDDAHLEFWAQIQELETALTNISTMPEYDQDDAHRLRNMAKRALADYT